MRIHLSVGFALILILAAGTGPAIANGQQTSPLGSESNPTMSTSSHIEFKVDYNIERAEDDPGAVLVTTTYDIPGRMTQFTAKIGEENHTVVSAKGLSEQSNGDYRWSGSPDDPELTYKVDVNDTSSEIDGLSGVDTGDWALFSSYKVRLYHTWRYTGSGFGYDGNVTVAEGETGYIDQYAFLGPHNKHTITTKDGAVTLILPDAAAAAESPEEIAKPIQASTNSLRVSPRKDEFTLFVVTDPMREGGQSVRGAMWVHESAPTTSRDNVWTHEYIHERQTWNLSSEVEWVTEGSAAYYDHLIPLRQGWGSYEEFRDGVNDDEYDDEDLSDPQSWSSYRTQYQGGAMAVGLIDTRIRQETNGTDSFQSVLYWMNRHNGQISQQDFFDIVERVVGHPIDEYLRSVTESRAGMTVPDNPALYTYTSIRDHDDDGLTNEEEAQAGTHPFVSDTDYDGLNDSAEIRIGTDPTDSDTDGDGEPDGAEVDAGGDPLATPATTSESGTEGTDGIIGGLVDLVNSVF